MCLAITKKNSGLLAKIFGCVKSDRDPFPARLQLMNRKPSKTFQKCSKGSKTAKITLNKGLDHFRTPLELFKTTSLFYKGIGAVAQ